MNIFEKTFETDDMSGGGDSGRIFTFALTPGEEAKIIFVENAPPTKVYVHNVFDKHGVRFEPPWDIFCLSTYTGKECPFCKHYQEGVDDFSKKFKRFPIYIYPIIDLRPYKIKSGEREGEVVPYTRKALVLKNSSQQALHEQFKTRKEAGDTSMAGMCFSIKRSKKEKSARSGDSFSFFKYEELDNDRFGELSAPFETEELESLVLCNEAEALARYEKLADSGASVMGSHDDAAGQVIDSDDVPF